jgi:hypothetical protein
MPVGKIFRYSGMAVTSLNCTRNAIKGKKLWKYVQFQTGHVTLPSKKKNKS